MFLPLNQCMHGNIYHRLLNPFKMPQGGCKWLDRDNIRVGEVSVHFQLKVKTLGSLLSVPTDKI